MQILVFKTNLSDTACINEMEYSLNVHPNIYKWNVDLDDNDHILGVMSNHITGHEIETLLFNNGYYCEELQD